MLNSAAVLDLTMMSKRFSTYTSASTSCPTIERSRLTWNRKIISSLNRLQAVIETVDSEHKALYQETWQRLYDVVALWPRIGLDGGVIAWPYCLTDTFLALLQEGDWISRILYLHYGVALRLLGNRWYVRDLGRRLVSAMLESIEEIPSAWSETITWIKSGVGVYR